MTKRWISILDLMPKQLHLLWFRCEADAGRFTKRNSELPEFPRLPVHGATTSITTCQYIQRRVRRVAERTSGKRCLSCAFVVLLNCQGRVFTKKPRFNHIALVPSSLARVHFEHSIRMPSLFALGHHA